MRHSILPQITTILLDLLAPRRCLCCGAYDAWLCEPCRRGIAQHHIQQVCYYCKKAPTPYGNLCTHCRGATPLRSILIATAPTKNDRQLLAKAIHYYKYAFVRELSHPLGLLLAERATTTPLPLPDIIIPVPLHPRRLRWRGFNQSHLLAHVIACRIAPPLKVPLSETLVRARYTAPQARATDHTKRINNLKDAFAVNNSDVIAGKRILLVDDVATTGATLIECAHTLTDAGATSVDAIALSRGV